MQRLPFIVRLLAFLVLSPAFPAKASSSDGPNAATMLSGEPVMASPADSGAPASSAVSPPIEVKDGLHSIATVDLTESPDDLWDRVRHGFAMPDITSDLVVEWQAWYLSRPEYLKRVVDRSRRYLYHIVEELEKRGMPTELALLPMVESAYNPMAYSTARASGIWQFIPSTGKTFRLEQNWWVDQRRDIVASTSAALEYLQQIYEMHGDWHLALASYNWGEGAVARAIARNKSKALPTDYQSLTMPNETRNYVPKLQALKNIIARPDLFNVNLESIPNRPYFVTVEKPADMDIAVAAKLAEMSLEEFIALNPAYKRPVMPAKDKASIILPVDKAEIFRDNLENHGAPLVNWQVYTLRKGERIETLASRFNISAARLRQVNGIHGKGRVLPGQTLLVPGRAKGEGRDLMQVNLAEIQTAPETAAQKRTGKRSPKSGAVKKSAAKQPAPKKGRAKGVARKTSAPGAKAARKPVGKPAAKQAKRPAGKRDNR